MYENRITTEEFAAKLGIKPGTLRAAVSRNKSYYGLVPIKAPNRFLLWPADAAEQVLNYRGCDRGAA